MAATDFEVPVGKPEIDGIFAGNGVAVAVKGIVECRVYAAGQIVMVAAHHGIVNGFGVGGNFRCVGRIFCRVNKIEMIGACGFPVNVAIVAVKTVGKGYANAKKDKA